MHWHGEMTIGCFFRTNSEHWFVYVIFSSLKNSMSDIHIDDFLGLSVNLMISSRVEAGLSQVICFLPQNLPLYSLSLSCDFLVFRDNLFFWSDIYILKSVSLFLVEFRSWCCWQSFCYCFCTQRIFRLRLLYYMFPLLVSTLGRPRGIGWGGRWERGSEWGTHVHPWLIHVNVWQKPPQYCKVISLQLIKINEKQKQKQIC